MRQRARAVVSMAKLSLPEQHWPAPSEMSNTPLLFDTGARSACLILRCARRRCRSAPLTDSPEKSGLSCIWARRLAPRSHAGCRLPVATQATRAPERKPLPRREGLPDFPRIHLASDALTRRRIRPTRCRPPASRPPSFPRSERGREGAVHGPRRAERTLEARGQGIRERSDRIKVGNQSHLT